MTLTVKREDNLRPEGEFYTPEKTPFRPAERPQQVRPEDNLKPEGKFERPVKESYRPADVPQAGWFSFGALGPQNIKFIFLFCNSETRRQSTT